MPVIEVEHLHKRYRERVAVEDVSFAVERGEIFGIIGPNGAGKTTTVECIEGLRRPDAGSVRVLGLDPTRDERELRQRLGVQLQSSELPENLTVEEALELYGSFYRKPADREHLLESLGLSAQRHVRFGQLSGGQKQRLSVALALVGSPEIVVLDELTSGLDPSGRRETWALIDAVRASGVTILLVTHFMDEAERLCDRLAMMERGRVVAIDTPGGLKARVRAEHRIRLRLRDPLGDRLLSSLPEVSSVERHGDEVYVSGTGQLLHAVTSTLAGNGIVINDLEVEQATLEDAFVALTGYRAAS